MSASPQTNRLPAAERRQAIVDAAQRVFITRSYARATTADIAREAKVSEPILYRHFPSKRELYFACLESAWEQLRDQLEAKLGTMAEDGAEIAFSNAALAMRRSKARVPNLWLQAVNEAGEDPQIQRHIRAHMREVHDYVAGALRRAQDAGRIPADRDLDAEAWIFIAGGLLLAVADRLGGVLGPGELDRISAQRQRWLLGSD